MVDTAGTLGLNAKKIYEFDPNGIIGLMAHPLLMRKSSEILKENRIKLVTTDSVAWSNLPFEENTEVLSLDYVLAEAIDSMITGESMRHLFDYQEYKRVKKEQDLW